MENELDTNSRFDAGKYAHKKIDFFYRKVLKLQGFRKVFANVGGNALFWRGH